MLIAVTFAAMRPNNSWPVVAYARRLRVYPVTSPLKLVRSLRTYN